METFLFPPKNSKKKKGEKTSCQDGGTKIIYDQPAATMKGEAAHHRLVPISPFAEDHGDDHHHRGDDDAPPPSLKLPGRFGREALLRPVSEMCPTCRGRQRRRRRRRPTEDDDDAIPRPSCSSICELLRSMAKFIPREDFWNFVPHDEYYGGGTMRLEISGKDTHRLVRILRRVDDDGGDESIPATKTKTATMMTTSTSYVPTESFDADDIDPRVMLLNEGDVVSILWHDDGRGRRGGGTGCVMTTTTTTIDYSNLVPLVRYRLTRIVIDDEGTDRPGDGPPGDDLADAMDLDDADGGNVAPLVRGDVHDAENRSGDGIVHRRDDGGDDNGNSSPSSSSSSSGEGRSINIDGLVRNVAREFGYRPPDAQSKYDDIFRDGENHRRVGDGGIEPTANGKDDDACLDSANGSSREEDEAESSAPLTLPSQFLATYYSNSSSFDSVGTSPSIAHASPGGADVAGCAGPTTPRKRDPTGKRPHCNDAESIKAADNTPKKSNITIEEKIYKSVSMSSLSYDQLVQLHKEATTPNIIDETSPSLRRTVLSLTLALTSNVSLYNSYFLNDYNAEADEMLPIKGRQWMPRLLQGTQIKKLQER